MLTISFFPSKKAYAIGLTIIGLLSSESIWSLYDRFVRRAVNAYWSFELMSK
jgi:hypothetical protein